MYDLRSLRTYRNRTYRRWLEDIRRVQKWSRKEIEDYQNRHLREIVRYAYSNVPFYRKLYRNIDISGIKSTDDLQRLPIVTKEMILKNSDVHSVSKERYIISHTSGTTGTPLEIRVSPEQYYLTRAIWYGARFEWSGYDGGWIARFVGDSPVKDCSERILYRKARPTKRLIFPSYCISFQSIPLMLEAMKKYEVRYIRAYPSTAYLLARYLEHTDTEYILKALFYSSEPMYPYQREVIERRFGVRPSGVYGQAENAVSALECENGRYHLISIDGITEILRGNERVSDGEKGLMTVTALHNRAMPLIRYMLGDYTGFSENDCACGRELPVIYPIETKMEDFIVTPDGKAISPSVLTFPLKHARGIEESQIVQRKMDEVIIRIVRGDSYTEDGERELLSAMKEILGPEMSVRIQYVREIHRSSAHKKRFVINEMGGDYIERFFREQ